MAEVVLDQAQVVAAIGEGKPTGMAKHVGMDMADPGTFSGDCEDIVDGLPGERLLPFGDEQPRQPVFALPEPATDCP